MRKPRDYDAELKALAERSRELRARKLVQLGELVTSCGADRLPIEVLAGVLLETVATKDASRMEAWRTSGGEQSGHLKVTKYSTAAIDLRSLPIHCVSRYWQHSRADRT